MKKFLFTLFVCANTFAFAQSGITWNMGMNISTNTYSNMHPRMTLDRAGNPLVIWGRMSDASVFFSRWNGTMFTTPVKLNPPWMTVATAGWMGPDIASYGDTVYVVVKRTPEALDTNYTYIMTSLNGGVSFSAPVRIDFIADSISRFPTVAVDATGNPIVAFMKFNATFGDARWAVARSTDFGNTFSADVKASGWSSMTSTVCDCCPGAILNSGNTVAMLYRDNNSNIRDAWAGLSTNSGTSFSAGIGIDQQNWMLMMCPSSGPDGVIIGDTLYSAFMNGASGMNKVFFNKSSVSSATGSAGIPITGNITGLTQQNYPRVAASGNALAVVWKQVVNGSTQLPILFTNNIANGFPAAYDTVDLNDNTNADVAMSNGTIFVVWQDDNSGTVKYRTGTYTPSTTSVNEIEQNNFSVFPNPTADVLNIILPSTEKYFLSIFNSLGQKIYSEESTSNNKLQTTNLKLQTSNFPSGIYSVVINDYKNVFTKKIIKQ